MLTFIIYYYFIIQIIDANTGKRQSPDITKINYILKYIQIENSYF